MGTKRAIFEFRGSKIKEIRTAVGGTDSPEAHTAQHQAVEAGVDASKVTWVTSFALDRLPNSPPYRAHIRVCMYE